MRGVGCGGEHGCVYLSKPVRDVYPAFVAYGGGGSAACGCDFETDEIVSAFGKGNRWLGRCGDVRGPWLLLHVPHVCFRGEVLDVDRGAVIAVSIVSVGALMAVVAG